MNNFFILSFMLFFFTSCSVSPRYSSADSKNKSKKTTSNKANKSSPRYSSLTSVNNSNLVSSSGKTSSLDIRDHNLKGISSWYGPNFHGKLTANGEIFDELGVTAAHKTLPLGTTVKVINLDNNKSVILRITDRGPYVGDRIIDCSKGAAIKLGFKDLGTANVEVEILEWGDGIYMHRKK